MKQTTAAPAPPAHFPEEMQEQWTATYHKAFEGAKSDNGGNERAAHMTAVKTANAMQKVTPPTSAADIDALQEHEVVHRSTKHIVVRGVGVPTRVCVTSDGRKYAFPVDPPAPEAKPAKPAKTAS